MESAKELQGRILLVDDESAILRTFRYCLEDEGYGAGLDRIHGGVDS